MNQPEHPREYPFSDRFDWLLFGVTIAIGVVYTWYIYANNLLLMMVDQYSHLAIARQVTDSMTPGLSQLGFWPPLLHILMAPATAVDFLYQTGLAAPITLVPILAISVVFMYRLVLLLTGHRLFAILAVAAYLLNPYVLYYSVTPMSDMLFVSLMVMASYFFADWWINQHFSSLLWLGGIASLATMARFEGIFLVAFAGLGVLARLYQLKKPYHQIEASAVLYGLLAGLGFLFIVVYSLIFAGDPMAFMNNEWGAYSQQRSLFLPTEHNIVESLRYLAAASRYMIGEVGVWLALLSTFCLWFLLKRGRLLFTFLLLVVGSPFIFDLFALFQGSAIIYVPELPPFDSRFFNERYGLNWLPLAILLPTLLASFFYERIRRIRWYYEPLAIVAATSVLLISVFGSYSLFQEVTCRGCFPTIVNSLQSSPPDHERIARILHDEYDGGRVLMTRALHNQIAVEAGIPLSHYILEANEFYFDQALAYPWFFAEWVVMQNNANDEIHSDWSKENELVAKNWWNDWTFLRFYEEKYSGQGTILYQLKSEEVLTYSAEYGIPLELVPALSRPDEPWEVESTFFVLQDYIEKRNAVAGLSP